MYWIGLQTSYLTLCQGYQVRENETYMKYMQNNLGNDLNPTKLQKENKRCLMKISWDIRYM